MRKSNSQSGNKRQVDSLENEETSEDEKSGASVGTNPPVPNVLDMAEQNMVEVPFACCTCRHHHFHGQLPGRVRGTLEEARLMSTCESCGEWNHNMCFPCGPRDYLWNMSSLLSQEGLSAPGGSGAASFPKQQVLCGNCSSAWSRDCFNLSGADEACTRQLTNELSRVWGHAHAQLSASKGVIQSGALKAINAVMARCDAEAKGIAGTALVVLLIGPAGVGKSLLLDAMTCMWPDSAYTTPPDGWQPVSMRILPSLKVTPQQRVMLYPRASDGSPLFCDQGRLLGMADELARDAAVPQHLADYFVEQKGLLRSSLCARVLPSAREDNNISTTTSASIMVLRGLRHEMLLLTLSADQLLRVVQGLQQKENEGGILEQDEEEMLQAVFGVSGLAGLLALLGVSKEALGRVAPLQLSRVVSPQVLDVLGELGNTVQVALPGLNAQHERVYLSQLLSRVCGQLNSREPWMWLVWLAVRCVPSGLLPESDALVDVAGDDNRPLHQVFRSLTLDIAHAVILVMRNDFGSCKPNPLRELDDAGVLDRVVSGKLSMMVVATDHDSYPLDYHLDPVRWQPVQAKWDRQESGYRMALGAYLAKKGSGSREEWAAKFPVVTTRALMLRGLVSAWGAGRLAGHTDQQLEELLLHTGAFGFYSGLGSKLKDDTIKVVSAIKSRTSKLAEMMAVLLGLEHPQLPGADRLGGLGQLENCREEECIAALDQLSGVMHHFKPEAIFATVGQQKREEGLLKLEALWEANGRTEAEARVRTAARNGEVLKVEMLKVGLQAALQPSSTPFRRSKLEKYSLQLVPLFEWVDGLQLSHLQQLLEPFKGMLVQLIEESYQKVPAFQQLPELQRLKLLWLQYVLPLVSDSQAHTTANIQAMLQELKQELRNSMFGAVMERLKLFKTSPEDAGFVDSLEAFVIKGSWQDVAGPSGRLITDVLGMLHKYIIKKPLADLTQAGNKTSSGAAWHITLVKRLKTDLSILMNPRNLNNLKGHVDDLHVPVVDMRDNLDWQIERGAANMAKIIVLMHRHAHLLNKYTTYSVNHFHTVADRRQYDDFKKAPHNGVVHNIPGAELGQLLATQAGDVVDLDHLCMQLDLLACGVTGQMVVPGGTGLQQLSLGDRVQQPQVLRDLLQLKLIRAAMEELHDAPGHTWFSKAAGASACMVLTEGSHLTNPLHTLAVLALLLRCYMRVRIPYNVGAAAASAKKPRTSGANSSRGRHSYLFYKPPTASADPPGSSSSRNQIGPFADETQVADILTSLAAPAAGNGPSAAAAGVSTHRRDLLVQLVLHRSGSSWHFDVVSSTEMSSKRTAAVIGARDDQYEYCVMCQQWGPQEEELVTCSGEFCAVAVHAHHLTPQEVQDDDWQCPTCKLRGVAVAR